MAASSSASSTYVTESAAAKDINVIHLPQNSQKKSVQHSRVAVLTSHDRLEVTKSLQIREKRLLQEVECVIVSGDPGKSETTLK